MKKTPSLLAPLNIVCEGRDILCTVVGIVVRDEMDSDCLSAEVTEVYEGEAEGDGASVELTGAEMKRAERALVEAFRARE